MHFLLCLLTSFRCCLSLLAVFLFSSTCLLISTSSFVASSFSSSIFFADAALSFAIFYLLVCRTFIDSCRFIVSLGTDCVVLVLGSRLTSPHPCRAWEGQRLPTLKCLSNHTDQSRRLSARRCLGRSSPVTVVLSDSFTSVNSALF